MTARVVGRVQGVGFRYYTADLANSLGLSGWVRNEQDGSVEVEVQGASEIVDGFLQQLREGPQLAHVKDVFGVELPVASEESEFEVRY